MTIEDARNKGFIRGTAVEVAGTFRLLKVGRIEKKGEVLWAMERYPFIIYQFAHWLSKIMKVWTFIKLAVNGCG